MRSYTFTVLVEPDEDGFHAFVPVLRGCHTFGDTIEEALANVLEAAQLHVESLLEDGEEVPEAPPPIKVERVTIAAAQ